MNGFLSYMQLFQGLLLVLPYNIRRILFYFMPATESRIAISFQDQRQWSMSLFQRHDTLEQ